MTTILREKAAKAEDEDEEYESPPSSNYCSFAVLGTIAPFQAIFIYHKECCNQNSSDQAAPLFICQAYANIFHDCNSHEVEYIGMGPYYCDCDHVGKCHIFQVLQIEAERLGAVLQSHKPNVQNNEQANPPQESYLHHIYGMSMMSQV
jgi:hypothetical protein